MPKVNTEDTNTCLLVLGMHRSGTSAVTRALNLAGLQLPKNLLGGDQSNPSGHWEPENLVLLNEDILNSMGRSWDDWRQLDFDEISTERHQYYIKSIVDLIAKEYDLSAPFVLKDPRVSRVSLFYLEALKKLNVTPKCLVMIRNPIEVVQSLSERNDMHKMDAALLWLRYTLDAERASRNYKRAFLTYEQLLKDKSLKLFPTLKHLDYDLDNAVEVSEIDSFLNPKLKNQTAKPSKIENYEIFGDLLDSIYTGLTTHSQTNSKDLPKSLVELIDNTTNLLNTTDKTFYNIKLQGEADRQKASASIHDLTYQQEQMLIEKENKIAQLLESNQQKILAIEEELSGKQLNFEAEKQSLAEKLAQTTNKLSEQKITIDSLQQSKKLELENLLAQKNSELDVVKKEYKAKLKKLLAQKDSKLNALAEEKNSELIKVLDQNTTLKNRLNDQEAKLFDLNANYVPLKRHVETIERSRSWKLVHRISVMRRNLRDALSYSLPPNIKFQCQKLRLRFSKYFSSKYYLEANNDVNNAGAEPVEHYLLYGANEGRNPSPHFDTSHYLHSNPDVGRENINPLWHFLRSGIKEHRSPLPALIDDSRGEAKPANKDIRSLINHIGGKTEILPPSKYNEISVIVPIYNGYDHLLRLLPSLVKNTPTEINIILSDDKSPDKKILKLIEEYATKHSNIEVLKHEANKGFIGNVNSAMENAQTRRYVALVNSDTQVPPLWIDRLFAPMLQDPSIASTTPWSNAATIYSMPKKNTDNPAPSISDVDFIDTCVAQLKVDPEFQLEAPSGVGFCMGVDGHIWKEIGPFDAEKFGRGYAEENDWCQRAIFNGYKNVLVPNLYVAHAHGGSFCSDEKNKLVEKNLKTLGDNWPNYHKDVQLFIENDPWDVLRLTTFLIQCCSLNPVVIFDHQEGGGANLYRNKVSKEHIENGRPVILITYDLAHKHLAVLLQYKDHTEKFTTENVTDLLQMPVFKNGADIFYNNVVFWEEPFNAQKVIQTWAKSNTVHLSILIHDYFPVCPSYTLLNDKGVHCEVPNDLTVCKTCLPKNSYAPIKPDLVRWREAWGKSFALADKVMCFSEASKKLVLRAYPDIKNKVKVKLHSPLPGKLREVSSPSSDTFTICVVGALNHAKGSKTIVELAKYLKEAAPGVRIVIIGEINPEDSKNLSNLYVHGRYQRLELPELLEKYEMNVCFIPSIWPETFSYVTQELMACNVPLACFALGAPADRIKQYKKGSVIKSHKSEDVWSALKELDKRISSKT